MGYTALVLDHRSQQVLRELFETLDHPTWEVQCHHMTINMGSPDRGPANSIFGQRVSLRVETVGIADKVVAVGVQTRVPSINAVKHITLGVDREAGGKPVMSNDITTWLEVKPIVLRGVVTFVK